MEEEAAMTSPARATKDASLARRGSGGEGEGSKRKRWSRRQGRRSDRRSRAQSTDSGDADGKSESETGRDGDEDEAVDDEMARRGRHRARLEKDGGGRGTHQDREWARLLLRELYDLGYTEAAASLEREAAVRVRSLAMEKLQRCVERHEWDAALAYVNGPRRVVQMRSVEAAREVTLLLRKRKYIEFLQQKQLEAALLTFQNEILPNFALTDREIQELAVLLLCKEGPQLEHAANIPLGDSALLQCIEQHVSADEFVPSGSLRRMVQRENDEKVTTPSFADAEIISVDCIGLLLKHAHEVVHLEFSPNGKYLASASEDGWIFIWKLTFTQTEDMKSGSMRTDVKSEVVRQFHCPDGAPGDISWSPDSKVLLSCGGRESNVIQAWNPMNGRRGRMYQHPGRTVSIVQWLAGGEYFLSGSIEKSLVLWAKHDASIVYQWGGRRILDIAIHNDGKTFYALTSDSEIRVYNLRDKSDSLLFRSDRHISCITFGLSVVNKSSNAHLLLNYIDSQSVEYLDVSTGMVEANLSGFKQERYILRPCFVGLHNELVASGSEDGSVHFWRICDNKSIRIVHSHSSAVNTVVSHPVYRHVVASASDDETIRIWAVEGRST